MLGKPLLVSTSLMRWCFLFYFHWFWIFHELILRAGNMREHLRDFLIKQLSREHVSIYKLHEGFETSNQHNKNTKNLIYFNTHAYRDDFQLICFYLVFLNFEYLMTSCNSLVVKYTYWENQSNTPRTAKPSFF